MHTILVCLALFASPESDTPVSRTCVAVPSNDAKALDRAAMPAGGYNDVVTWWDNVEKAYVIQFEKTL